MEIQSSQLSDSRKKVKFERNDVIATKIYKYIIFTKAFLYFLTKVVYFFLALPQKKFHQKLN